MIKFVKIKIKTDAGPKTYWAQKLGTGKYREVNKTGEWGYRGKIHQIITSPRDLIWEKPAHIDKKYGTLTTETAMIKLTDLLSEDRYDGADHLWTYEHPNGAFTVTAYQMDSKMGGKVEAVVHNNRTGKQSIRRLRDDRYATAFHKALQRRNPDATEI